MSLLSNLKTTYILLYFVLFSSYLKALCSFFPLINVPLAETQNEYFIANLTAITFIAFSLLYFFNEQEFYLCNKNNILNKAICQKHNST